MTNPRHTAEARKRCLTHAEIAVSIGIVVILTGSAVYAAGVDRTLGVIASVPSIITDLITNLWSVMA